MNVEASLASIRTTRRGRGVKVKEPARSEAAVLVALTRRRLLLPPLRKPFCLSSYPFALMFLSLCSLLFRYHGVLIIFHQLHIFFSRFPLCCRCVFISFIPFAFILVVFLFSSMVFILLSYAFCCFSSLHPLHSTRDAISPPPLHHHSHNQRNRNHCTILYSTPFLSTCSIIPMPAYPVSIVPA